MTIASRAKKRGGRPVGRAVAGDQQLAPRHRGYLPVHARTISARSTAAYHGIEGMLQEELLDLSAQAPEEIALLRVTPAAGGIGTCRYKLKDEPDRGFRAASSTFSGRTTSATCSTSAATIRWTRPTRSPRWPTNAASTWSPPACPRPSTMTWATPSFKLIDHTPGYGSVARYWACKVQEANEENDGSWPSDPVLVLQAMGRKIGFIPAAARLGDPQRRAAAADLPGRVGPDAERHGRPGQRRAHALAAACIVVVSEGFDVGDMGERTRRLRPRHLLCQRKLPSGRPW